MSLPQSEELKDPALVAAVDLAHAAAQEEAGEEEVGPHVGTEIEGEAAVTHLFEAEKPGYRGWHWAVTVSSAGAGTDVTVSEVVLLPGPDALVAPEWVPWENRVRAGDLGVGDLLPTAPDDPRLVPAYLASDDPAVEEVALEAGLGRVRVMSRPAREDAAVRWVESEFGPRSDMARSAPGRCGTCGFYLRLAGSLGAAFGTCGNEISPADGHVVHAEYGCGAHSEAEVEQVSPVLVANLIYDDALLDVVEVERPAEAQDVAKPAPAAAGPSAAGPSADTDPVMAKAAPQPEPAATESATQTDPAPEPEPAVAEPVTAAEPPVAAGPAPETEPTAEIEPTSEPESATDSSSVVESVVAGPTTQTEPSAAAPSVAEATAETEPLAAAPSVETEPTAVTESSPVAEPADAEPSEPSAAEPSVEAEATATEPSIEPAAEVGAEPSTAAATPAFDELHAPDEADAEVEVEVVIEVEPVAETEAAPDDTVDEGGDSSFIPHAEPVAPLEPLVSVETSVPPAAAAEDDTDEDAEHRPGPAPSAG